MSGIVVSYYMAYEQRLRKGIERKWRVPHNFLYALLTSHKIR